LTLTARVTVKFGDHRDGVFSIWLADALQETHTGVMTSVDGCAQEKGSFAGGRSVWTIPATGTNQTRQHTAILAIQLVRG
jgi:hypothetical protein